MSDRILVTGAAGYIGSRLAAILHRGGAEVTALDVRPVPEPVASRCEVLLCDFRAPDVAAQICSGRYRAVVHQAAVSNTLERDWAKLKAVNVAGTLGLAESCLTAGIDFVYASSFSVYGRTGAVATPEDALGTEDCSGPLNLYARSKLATDTAMAAFSGRGLRWYGLRYTNVFGRDEELAGRASSIISQMVDRAARGQPVELFADTLTAARDYVPIEAVVAAVTGLLGSGAGSGCYNVGAGHAVPFETLLRWCVEFRGGDPLDVRLIPNPIPDRYQYWTQADPAKLRAAVPGFRDCGPAEIRAEAHRRFDWTWSPSRAHSEV